MSKSIHITVKDFKGLTKAEIDNQASNPNSDLNKWNEKSKIKREVKLDRKRNELKNKKRVTTTPIIYCFFISKKEIKTLLVSLYLAE